jgi:LPS-assembly protein
MDVIIEPIAMAGVGTKGGNDVRIANEDSLAFELDDSSIFRPSGAPNYDLWEPGTRGSAGVRATVRAHNGYSGSVMFGQRWRDEDDPRFSAATNLRDNKSDYVAAVRADLGGHFGVDARVRLDSEEFDATRIDAGVRGSLWRVSANARYYSVEQSLRPGDPSKELRSGASLRLTDRWSVSYGMQRDLNLDRTLTQSAQLTYRDDCTFFEVTYQRNETFDRVLGPDEGFRIRVGLNSLGVLGGN